MWNSTRWPSTAYHDFIPMPGAYSGRETNAPGCPKRRVDGNAAARHDPSVGKSVRYVFVHRGRPMSRHYLFEEPLAIACRQVGLVDGQGRPTVTAHRFRHTVGTQLAEGGARIQTIMAILGHRSAQMSAIYSRVSDPIVKEQYERIIATGGRIAGPAATALLDNQLATPPSTGSKRTSSKPSSNSATAYACRKRVPAMAIS